MSFLPKLVSPNHSLLITDELPSPADFLLHQMLSSQLKNPNCTRCILLSAANDLDRWIAVAAKSTLNLVQHLNSAKFTFVDVLAETDPVEPSAGCLKSVFDAVLSILDKEEGNNAQRIVVLDDITSLHWIGFPLLELTRFARALHASCLTRNTCLVIRHHIITPSEPDDLFRFLLQICTYHIDVRPLSSGRSGSVSGEIALHAGPSLCHEKIRLIPRSSALQYRLTDGGALFFERGGTSSGVL